MKGLKKISDATQATREKIELYYSFATDTVYSKSGAGRHFVTYCGSGRPYKNRGSVKNQLSIGPPVV